MRKTLTLTLATALLAAGLAHASPPRPVGRAHDRVSPAELFRVAHEAQMRAEGLELAREAERAARDYSAARRVLAQSQPRLRQLVIKLKKDHIEK
jgi:hypothetical protein